MKLKLICLIALLLYLPSLFNYFSHDDFFNLQLARVSSWGDFWQFFDLFHTPERVGSYRPLTTQVYFLASYFFNLSPLPLHIIAFAIFFADIFLVYKLAMILLGRERPALISAFLYAVSATHFAHLYWPSIFQETGLIFFFLSCVILFLKQKYFWSFVAMIGGFMSKETAIVIPAVLTLVVILFNRRQKISKLVPYYLAMAVFLYIHLVYYGLPPGEVYKLDFSPRIANTLMWYILWSFNLPEMFVDFVGPGLRLNPNLLNFYGREVLAIMLSFGATVLALLFAKKGVPARIFLFTIGWFLAVLLPVIFLPWHKFTYELGVPLVGLVILLAAMLPGRKIALIFCFAWFLTSFLTLQLTARTHWITLGPKIAWRVREYFKTTQNWQKDIVFYDTPADASLPWSPANEVKINLSDQDFFTVYYPGRFKVEYVSALPASPNPQVTYIGARQFLGY